MKIRSILFFALFTSIFVVSAFGQRSAAGQNWTLTYLRGVNIRGVDAYLNIDAAGMRFTGNTGCNIMNGSVRMRRNSIAFNAIITTKRACMRTTAPVEGSLLSALGRANRFQSSRNKLRLYSGNRLLAEFVPRASREENEEPPSVGDRLGLEDRKWTLEAVGNSPIPTVQQEAFIVFDPVKGSAGGNTSCNVFGGNYTANGSKLSITQTISTMRACIEDKRMEVERGFLDGLRTADRYEIRADKLTIYKGNKLLLSFMGRKK